MQVRQPDTDGWIVIQRSMYEAMVEHQYAGTDEDGTVWAMALDSSGATCLWRGLEIVDKELGH